MAYDLSEINMKTVTDPKGFCEECEAHYNEQLEKAAEMVAENLKNSPVILLAGPSGSAKTTTAMKLSETLKKRGVDFIGPEGGFLLSSLNGESGSSCRSMSFPGRCACPSRQNPSG